MATLEAQGRPGDWTYSADFTLARDWVRFTVGDTDPLDQLIADQEIAAAVADTGSKAAAAVRICEHLAARFARLADETVNDGAGNSRTRALSQRASAYLRLASQIRATGVLAVSGMPYAGGISQGDKDTREDNTDRVEPAFTVGMTDYV